MASLSFDVTSLSFDVTYIAMVSLMPVASSSAPTELIPGTLACMVNRVLTEEAHTHAAAFALGLV